MTPSVFRTSTRVVTSKVRHFPGWGVKTRSGVGAIAGDVACAKAKGDKERAPIEATPFKRERRAVVIKELRIYKRETCRRIRGLISPMPRRQVVLHHD